MRSTPEPADHRPPPATAPSAEALLRKQLAWYFLLRVLFLTLVLGITAILEAKGHRLPTDKYHYPLLFIVGVYLFTIISAVLAGRIHHLRRFATLQLVFDVALISCLVFFSGTSHSLFTVIYLLPIVVAGFLLFRREALLMAATSTLAYGGLLLLEYSQYSFDILITAPRPAASLERLLNLFAINGLSFFLVAALAALLAGRLYRTQEALSRTADRYDRLNILYKQIFDDITTGIVTIDDAGRITSFNRAAEEITGYRTGEVEGRQLAQFFPNIEVAGAEKMGQRAEIELARKDSATIPVGYSWSRLRRAAPGESHYILSIQDLSQLRAMEARIRQSEKMAAVGEMAAGIAHEFRNPLAAISGSTQLLAQRLKEQPGQEQLLQIINRECDRLEAAVNDFLLFSRPASPRPQWHHLQQLLDESLAVIRQTPAWSQQHRFTWDLPADPMVWADGDQLKQVLINLLANACQAMPSGGTIHGAAHRRQPGDGQSPGLVIEISDDGPGIAPESQARIFEPYFTTRQDGTGLGLAIVHQIIKGHGGEIELASTPGQGTTFTILLPAPFNGYFTKAP